MNDQLEPSSEVSVVAKRPKWFRRPRFQFSIASLLILTALVALWLGYVTNRARQQRRAVAALTALGVKVTYDWQEGQEKSGPAWLRKLIGDEYFQDVVRVDFSGARVASENTEKPNPIALKENDKAIADDPFGICNEDTRVSPDALKWLEFFPKLHSLTIVNCPSLPDGFFEMVSSLEFLNIETSDNGDESFDEHCLVGISRLTRLKMLCLFCDAVSDKTLKEIATFRELEHLRLCSDHITDMGVSELKTLSRLHYLDLSLSQVTDKGIAQLESLSQLEDLCLRNTQVKGTGLARLKNLEYLDLSDAGVTDQGLRELSHLPRLCVLHLSGPGITDTGLAYLKGLKNLETLFLSNDDVTGQGLAQLGNIPKLKKLFLFSEEIQDQDLKLFDALQSVESLYLSCPKVTEKGLLCLRKMPKLQALSFQLGVNLSPAEQHRVEQSLYPIKIWLPNVD